MALCHYGIMTLLFYGITALRHYAPALLKWEMLSVWMVVTKASKIACFNNNGQAYTAKLERSNLMLPQYAKASYIYYNDMQHNDT